MKDAAMKNEAMQDLLTKSLNPDLHWFKKLLHKFTPSASHRPLHISLNRNIYQLAGLPVPVSSIDEKAIPIKITAQHPLRPLKDALQSIARVKKVEICLHSIVCHIEPTAHPGQIEAEAQQYLAHFTKQATQPPSASSTPQQHNSTPPQQQHPHDTPQPKEQNSAPQTQKSKRSRIGFKMVAQRSEAEQRAIVEDVLTHKVGPSIASHGGKITLVDFKEATVYLKMEGGCQGCGQASVTLYQGVEKQLRSALPELVGVVDMTAHNQGENPYYT